MKQSTSILLSIIVIVVASFTIHDATDKALPLKNTRPNIIIILADSLGDHKLLPVQGISFLPALKNEKYTGHDVLCNEHFGAKYIRENGNWLPGVMIHGIYII